MRQYFTLSPIFQDSMIFQANKTIRLYGQCKKNVEITVKFLNQEIIFKTQSEYFVVNLQPENYLEKAFSFTVSAKKQSVVIYNCLIGDLFLFIGGKNIIQELSLSFVDRNDLNQDIRFLNLNKTEKWLISGKDSLEKMSLIAYLFSKSFHLQTKRPLGIVFWGNQEESIFTWSSSALLLNHQDINSYLNECEAEETKRLSKDFEKLKNQVFNYSFQAVVVYQGENDCQHYHLYEKLLNILIKSYRIEFKDPNLHFYLIQLSSFEDDFYPPLAINEIRIAQSNLCKEKEKVYLVSTVDVNEKDLFSTNKNILNQRLVKLILEKSFNMGKNNLCPQIFSYKQNHGVVKILIHNNYLPLVSKSGQKLGFCYTENLEDFYPIKEVDINNNQISLKVNGRVKEIRYGFGNNPACDISSSNGLPLLPFKIILL